MKMYRLCWFTLDSRRHVGAPRFSCQEAAERVAKLLRRDRAVTAVAVEAVTVRPVALPVPGPVPLCIVNRNGSPRWQPVA